MKKRSQRQEELKKQLKRRKRRRILGRALCIVLLAALCCWGVYTFIKVYQAEGFTVKSIEVEGNEVVDSQNVIDASGIQTGQNIFFIDMNAAYSGIKRVIETKSLRISKKFPDTIIISITEEPSAFAMVSGDKTYYLNSDETVVEISDYLRKTDIPLVSGFTGLDEAKIGQKVNLQPDWKCAEILKMLGIFRHSGYTDKVSEIIATTSNTYKIITKNNVVFVISDYDCFENNYDYIGTVLQKNQSNLDINLTTGENPIVKAR